VTWLDVISKYNLYQNKNSCSAENTVLNHDSLLYGSLWNFNTSQKVAASIPNRFIEIFLLTESFRPHYGLGVHSASNRNEYQEYLLGGCVGLTTLPPSRANSLENSGSPKGLSRLVKGKFYFVCYYTTLRLECGVLWVQLDYWV